jgi:alpha-N-arabinofuranosidase
MHEQPGLAQASELGLPLIWEPLGEGARRFQPHYGQAANSWRSLEIMGFPGETVGINQTIYLPVHRTLHYVGSLYAKHLSGASEITVSLRHENSHKVLVAAKVDATAESWKKYSFTLDLPANSLRRLEPADFAVAVEPDERVEVDELSLKPANAVNGFDPDEVSMAKAMHVSILRFGGNFTSTYNWRDGIGPQDKRVSMLNIAWGIPEYNTFGTDEFLRFCDMLNAEPQVDLNMGTGTPAEAAAWVRYIKQRHSGHVVWELGNELWGEHQTGSPSLEELPGRTLAFSRAVRAVDPKAELIATGRRPQDYDPYDAAQLTNPAGTFNYISTHFIRNTNLVDLPNPSPKFLAESGFALPIAVGRDLEAMQAEINQKPAFANKAHLAVTEWLFASRKPGTRSDSNNSPGFMNMGGGVMAAGFLNMLMRHSDIAPIDDMTGIMEFGGIWKKRGQVFGTPAYYAFRMYSTSDAARLLKVDTNTGVYSVSKGTRDVADIANVPYLDIVAALNEKKDVLTLFCVNRSFTEDLAASIQLDDFQPASTARVQVLKGNTIYEMNDQENTQRIIPVTSSLDVHSPKITHAFPRSSVTVITFQKQ